MIVTLGGKSYNLHKLMPWLSAFFFLIAVGVVWHEVRVYHWQEIVDSVMGISALYVAYACFWSILGYIALTLYDFLAMHYIGKRLSAGKIAFTSFIGFAVSNNAGHAVVSGGAVRLRFYGHWGLSASDIIKLIAFCGITYLLGAGVLFLIGYAVTPDDAFIARRLPHVRLDWLAAGIGLSLIAYLIAVIRHRRSYHVKGVELSLPSLRMTFIQSVLGAVDLLLAGLVFYTLLRHYIEIPFGYFLGIYVVAQVIGLISQVPGGIGVFEGIFLFMLSNVYPSTQILGALIVYRIVYYFVPLGVAGMMMMLYESGLWTKLRKRRFAHADPTNEA